MKRQWSIVAIAAVMWVSSATVALAAELPVKPSGVDPAAFAPSTSCVCHQGLVDTWQRSMHAKAISDPVYQAKKSEANEATDGQLGQFCDTCHAPGATMTGEIASGAQLSAGTGEGINCSWCHQVSGMVEGEPGNNSHLLTLDGTMRAQIQDAKSPAHATAFSPLHADSKMCGGCHNVNHPVNGMHLESTYREWAGSAYAEEGVNCQDCHMSASPTTIGPGSGVVGKVGPQRDGLYSMTFWGANVEQGDAEGAKAMLRKAATVDVASPEILASGESTDVAVTITNVGAGHYLPTGLTEVREMWLEVDAVAGDGTVTTLGERRFGTILQDKDGNSPVELWEATTIKSDDRIPPRESVTSTFPIEMPAAASVTLSAKLLYRSMGDDLATKAGASNPVTEMAAAEQALYSSAEAKDAAEKAQPEPAAPAPASNTTLYLLIGGLVVLGAGVGGYLWARTRAK